GRRGGRRPSPPRRYVPDQSAHGVAGGREQGAQLRADEPRGAGHEDPQRPRAADRGSVDLAEEGELAVQARVAGGEGVAQGREELFLRQARARQTGQTGTDAGAQVRVREQGGAGELDGDVVLDGGGRAGPAGAAGPAALAGPAGART